MQHDIQISQSIQYYNATKTIQFFFKIKIIAPVLTIYEQLNEQKINNNFVITKMKYYQKYKYLVVNSSQLKLLDCRDSLYKYCNDTLF